MGLHIIASASIQEKGEMARTIGFEFALLDKKLGMKMYPWFEVIQNGCSELEERYLRILPSLEPCKVSGNAGIAKKPDPLEEVRFLWLG